ADAATFNDSIGFHARRFLRPAAMPAEIHFVPAGRLRWLGQRSVAMLAALTHRSPALGGPALLGSGGVFVLLSLIANLAASRRTRPNTPHGISSSVLMVLGVNAENARVAYKYSINRITRVRERRRRGLPDAWPEMDGRRQDAGAARDGQASTR